jgi:carbamoyltransferase
MSNDFTCAIAYNWHDSSVSFALDNKIILVLEAERVFRKKKLKCTMTQMEILVKHGCALLGKKIEDIKFFALQTLGNPHLLKEQKVSRPPFWLKLNIFGLRRNCLIVNHHLAHASAFLYSPYSDALVLTCDGGGDFGERVSCYYGSGNKLEKLDINTDGFISAKMYDLCSSHLYSTKRPTKDPYLTPPRAEGKMMALAAYGIIKPSYTEQFKKIEYELSSTNYQDGYDLLNNIFPELSGGALNNINDAKHFAASVHNYFIKRRLEDIENYLKLNLSSNIVLSGGAHLNLELNTKISKIISNIFVPPCCDDTGQALGTHSILITTVYGVRPDTCIPFLGEGNKMSENIPDDTFNRLVKILKDDQILLIHNGKSEIGPRALGNRSFIARADSLEIKKVLSEQIKTREWYRPVAPIILEDRLEDYYIGPTKSPYMLYSYQSKQTAKKSLPATIHVDGSARVQTVSMNDNQFMFKLLKKWGDETGHPVLLNTSLNLKGMPLSNTAAETIEISDKIQYKNTVVIDGEIL